MEIIYVESRIKNYIYFCEDCSNKVVIRDYVMDAPRSILMPCEVCRDFTLHTSREGE